MLEFAKPLLDAAGHDQEQMNKALQFGMIFWNIAVCAEAVGEEMAKEQLSKAERELCNSSQDCKAFRGMAQTLFGRYAQIRPNAQVDMPRILESLWGPSLADVMPKLGLIRRIGRTAKRLLTTKADAHREVVASGMKQAETREGTMLDIDEHEVRVLEILGGEDVSVSDQSLKRYLDYLKQNIQLPCLLTGGEDFDWEEYYVLGPGDEDEYKELKKTRPSYRDTFELLSFERWQDRGICVDVRRVADKKQFELPLADLKAVDKKSANRQIVEDYAVWFVNY